MSSSPMAASACSTASSVASSTSFEAAADAFAHAQGSHAHHRQALPLLAAARQSPTLEISPEEQAHYDRVVGRVLYRAVQEYAGYSGKVDRSLWTPVRRNHDMAIFRSLKGSGDPRVTLMLGVGRIAGSLEDVMDGLYSDHSDELRTVMTFLKSKFIVGSIMHVSERRTPDDPFNFAGIKWFAAKTPGGPVSYDRDLLTYERQGMTFDSDGNEIAYHLLQSVDRPEWPANTFKSLIRSHCSICYLYKRKGKRVETFFFGEFYGSGSFPQRVSDYAIAGKWLSVVNTVKCSEARKLSQLRQSTSTRSSMTSITISEINICHLCRDRRSLFSIQQLCGGCQQNVCRSCSEEKKLFELSSKSSSRPLTDRFCRTCLERVAKQRGSKIHWDGVDAEQPPAYFDYVFQLSKLARASDDSAVRSAASSIASASVETLFSEENRVDTAYIDASLQQQLEEFGEMDEESLEDLHRRKRSHAERLSSSLYTREQFLSDMGDSDSDS